VELLDPKPFGYKKVNQDLVFVNLELVELCQATLTNCFFLKELTE
jgi:hypothetical protein